MDENAVKNLKLEEQPENQVLSKEKLQSAIEAMESLPTLTLEGKDVVFRHPQQILTNNEAKRLFEKQAKINEENAEREKKGEEPVDGLTETEKGAIALFILRAKNHNSRPKVLSKKQRTAVKAKRRQAKKSRKANR